MKYRCALVMALFLGTPLQLFAEELPDFDFRNWTTGEDLEAYRSELYSLHQECAASASQRRLSGGEADMCVEIYLELKLSFLHGVTRERYKTMPALTRAKAHDMSYAAYRAWLHRQIAVAGSTDAVPID